MRLHNSNSLGVFSALLMLGAVVSSGCNDAVVTPPASDVVDGVYNVDSKPYGKSYAEWGADWWTWVFQLPAQDGTGKMVHPLFDSTGAFASSGQLASSPVYFLSGWFGGGGVFSRTITVASGKALFFPMINCFADTTGGWTSDSMRVAIDNFMSGVSGVTADVDGHSIANPTTYRMRTTSFSVVLPERNLYQVMGANLSSGTTMPMLGDGYWIMLAPLSTGSHTVHFKGSTGPDDHKSTLDMTYHVTVQ